jgi:hypothetical protein
MDNRARLEQLLERRNTIRAIKRLIQDGVPPLIAIAIAEELVEWKIKPRIDILA